MAACDSLELAEIKIKEYLESPLASDGWFGLTEQSTRKDFGILSIPFHQESERAGK
jgi:hypothetical protein